MLVLLMAAVTACGSPTPPSTAPADPTPVTATASAPAANDAGSAASWSMPNLVGSSLQAAQDSIQKLTSNAIVVTRSHDATGASRSQVLDRNWKVCSQNIPAGTPIDPSTKIDFGAVKVDERCP